MERLGLFVGLVEKSGVERCVFVWISGYSGDA